MKQYCPLALRPTQVRALCLSALRAIISVPLATLKELRNLSELKAKGVILERQYEVIKKHVTERATPSRMKTGSTLNLP